MSVPRINRTDGVEAARASGNERDGARCRYGGRSWHKERREKQAPVRERFAPLPDPDSEPTSKVVVRDSPYARALLASMDLREKVEQLLMVVTSDPASLPQRGFGGVTLCGITGSGEALQAELKPFHHLPIPPLLVAEWGSLELEDLPTAPQPITLGLLADQERMCEVGSLIGRGARGLGLDALLVPVVDAPLYLDKRDAFFGAPVSLPLMAGIQDAGAIALPITLPVEEPLEAISLQKLLSPLSRVESYQLQPLRAMTRAGVVPILLPHIMLPIRHGPISGLAAADLRLRWGGDQTLEGLDHLIKAIAETVSEKVIDERVLRLLNAKEWVRQQGERPPVEDYVMEMGILAPQLYYAATLVIRDRQKLLPLPKEICLLQVAGPESLTLARELARTHTLRHQTYDPKRPLLEQIPNDLPLLLALFPHQRLPAFEDLHYRLSLRRQPMATAAFGATPLYPSPTLIRAEETNIGAQTALAKCLNFK